ncbi:hypothetical protein [Streptomyces sp. NPDC049906]|uniref:hypothetical protein n=1 Tax=Streptomyces sp. NPDC049906 TaxID=3155656 RepID=UPI0034337FB1
MTGEGLTLPVPRARTARCVRCTRRTTVPLPVHVNGRARDACPRCGPHLTPAPTWDESPHPVTITARAIRILRLTCMAVPVTAATASRVRGASSVHARGGGRRGPSG